MKFPKRSYLAICLLSACTVSAMAFSVKQSNEVSASAQAQIFRVGSINKMFKQVASTIPSGMSAKGLWTSAQIESGGNPKSVNGKYAGLINMGEAEFKEYGPPFGDRMDPLHNLIAANSYIKSNAIILKEVLQRLPTEAELYLTLQQGRKGAPDLFRNPKSLAVNIRGKAAIVGNVPSNLKKQAEKWTCLQFTNYWLGRFNDIKKSSPDKEV